MLNTEKLGDKTVYLQPEQILFKEEKEGLVLTILDADKTSIAVVYLPLEQLHYLTTKLKQYSKQYLLKN